MENKGITKKEILITLGSLIGIVLIAVIGYSVLSGNGPKMEKKVDVSKVKGVGSTPEEVTIKFIYTAGNMGNEEKVTLGQLKNGTAYTNNYSRRYDSYKVSLDSIASGSPLLVDNIDSYMKEYTDTLTTPVYYKVDKESITIGNVGPEKDLNNDSTNGKTYTTKEVTASFVSEKTSFDLAIKDSSSDGSQVILSSKKRFDNVKFTLVKDSDSKWKIFDYTSKDSISQRFSTWNPLLTNNDSENMKTTGTIDKNGVRHNG